MNAPSWMADAIQAELDRRAEALKVANAALNAASKAVYEEPSDDWAECPDEPVQKVSATAADIAAYNAARVEYTAARVAYEAVAAKIPYAHDWDD